MKRRAVWKLSVATTSEAEDAVVELLQDRFAQPAVSYTDAETRTTAVTVYFTTRPKRFNAARAELSAALARVRQCGLKTGPAKISLRKIRREDWAESWKRHFQPMTIGPSLLIKPSWSRRRARRGQALVVIDPGLSFGTGRHPTTGFCLRQLAARRQKDARRSFLDIGTGSGILAIAAAKLGYTPVDAFDFDPESVRVARANARQNRVLDRLDLARADVTRLPLRPKRRYDFICANLISTLLLAERRRILARLNRGGVLVLAGILKNEFGAVRRSYERAGLKLLASRAEKEWRSGAFGYR